MLATQPDISPAPIGHLKGPKTDHRSQGWRARLSLRYGAAADKTVLLEQRHHGPLMVQKPFYPEGAQTCHTYLIHPPGGVVGGDKLGVEVTMEAASHAVITTPAAGKFYRSAGPRAAQVNELHVGSQAGLEWMPQETIVYNRANAKMRTIVRLDPGASFIGWEMVCLGLPASGQIFTHGQIDQRFDLWQADTPLFLEKFQIRESDALLSSKWGLDGLPVTGTMIATTGNKDLLNTIRDKTATLESQGLFTATCMNGLTVCRYLGKDVYAGFRYFLSAWKILRPAVMNRTVCLPRIWAT